MIEYARDIWITIVKRLLLRARGFRRGGAFLIAPTLNEARLNVKYRCVYERIPLLFEKMMAQRALELETDSKLDEALDAGEESIDVLTYLDHRVADFSANDAEEALSGAISFVAALSRVDGLVFLDRDLVARGFGCEILSVGNPERPAFSADHATPSRGKTRRLKMEKYGMRHRSMARYCSEDGDALGFVLSHDGPVRAMSGTRKRLYVWPNVQLTLRNDDPLA